MLMNINRVGGGIGSREEEGGSFTPVACLFPQPIRDLPQSLLLLSYRRCVTQTKSETRSRCKTSGSPWKKGGYHTFVTTCVKLGRMRVRLLPQEGLANLCPRKESRKGYSKLMELETDFALWFLERGCQFSPCFTLQGGRTNLLRSHILKLWGYSNPENSEKILFLSD